MTGRRSLWADTPTCLACPAERPPSAWRRGWRGPYCGPCCRPLGLPRPASVRAAPEPRGRPARALAASRTTASSAPGAVTRGGRGACRRRLLPHRRAVRGRAARRREDSRMILTGVDAWALRAACPSLAHFPGEPDAVLPHAVTRGSGGLDASYACPCGHVWGTGGGTAGRRQGKRSSERGWRHDHDLHHDHGPRHRQ